MKKYRYLAWTFGGLAVLLSDVMCARTAYEYCALEWCGRYGGCSAPASTALLLLIPYGVGIALCVFLCWSFCRKYRKGQEK